MTTYESRMSYLEPWSKELEAPYVRNGPDPDFESCNFKNLEYKIHVADARPNKDEFNLDTHGFAFHQDSHITEEILEVLRKNDKEFVVKEYYPMVEDLVKEKTGASKVVVFDHTIRRRDRKLAGSNPNGREQPASLVIISSRIRSIPVHINNSNLLPRSIAISTLELSFFPAESCLIAFRSPVGSIRRVYRHLGDEAEALLKGRAQIIK